MIQIKLAAIVRILSCIYIVTTLFSINTAQSYSLQDFDSTYDQRDASILYLRQLLKRLRLNNDDNLRWRKRTDATPKKCQEILSGMGYRGEVGPVIDNLATYQDCMNVCENDTQAAKETHCQEVVSGAYYYGTNIGSAIKQVATYQDCMSQCDASTTCMAWQYRASSKTCQLLATIQYNITDGQYTTGSCIKQQAPYPPKSVETSTYKAPSPSTTLKTSIYQAPPPPPPPLPPPPPPPPTPTPPPPPVSIETYRQQALDQHNFYRAKHCTPSLILDPALNDIAQTYAQKLADLDIFDHSYNKFNGQAMGENLFATGGGAFYRGNGSQPVGAWYNEIKDYDWSKPGYKGSIGHFTQLIWKDTTRLGIGRAVTGNNGTVYVVGNYFPAGNYIGAFEKNVLPLC
ncbi:unnamed protein product [Adineta steineri]|uniref:Apple domain-containing protein n=1 Tax=Adineta steineri TaxID=433720 RepID=A0A819AXD5_9BILA|nr:unnamed protein product [Adineta steineri]CAF3792565.1 unnamed protein product [Adineta steineri]